MFLYSIIFGSAVLSTLVFILKLIAMWSEQSYDFEP